MPATIEQKTLSANTASTYVQSVNGAKKATISPFTAPIPIQEKNTAEMASTINVRS